LEQVYLKINPDLGGKIQNQARCMEIEDTKAGLILNHINWTSSMELLTVNNFKLI
jgi:hypothetical protein